MAKRHESGAGLQHSVVARSHLLQRNQFLATQGPPPRNRGCKEANHIGRSNRKHCESPQAEADCRHRRGEACEKIRIPAFCDGLRAEVCAFSSDLMPLPALVIRSCDPLVRSCSPQPIIAHLDSEIASCEQGLPCWWVDSWWPIADSVLGFSARVHWKVDSRIRTSVGMSDLTAINPHSADCILYEPPLLLTLKSSRYDHMS